jgi:class 3 adenylate cyclase
MSLTLGEVAVGTLGSPRHPALALVGPSVHLGARLLKVAPPGGTVASGEMIAALRAEAPALAERFRLLDTALVVPGADGLTVAVYALADPGPAGARRPGPPGVGGAVAATAGVG